MAVLQPEELKTLKVRFRKELKRDITINLFTVRTAGLLVLPGRDCPTCPNVQELMQEITSLSSKLHLQSHDFFIDADLARTQGVDRIPCFTFETEEQEFPNMRYYGIPAGYEFSVFLDDLTALSRNVSPLQVSTRKALRRLDKEVQIQIFVTPN